MLLMSHFNTNLEIIDFSNGKIKYFDRQNDKDFLQKFSRWLNEKTGKQWVIETVEETQHKQTVSEHKKSEIESDPMVASAMDLFEGAEIVKVQK